MTHEETTEFRQEFEKIIRSSKRFSANTPLGHYTINGVFHHYMDPDTDTLFIGFAMGRKFGLGQMQN